MYFYITNFKNGYYFMQMTKVTFFDKFNQAITQAREVSR